MKNKLLTCCVFAGESGHYYCGMRVLTCACCDGLCGPQMGCNCSPCQRLDQDETKRAEIFGRFQKTLPQFKPQLESWTWGPQPSKLSV